MIDFIRLFLGNYQNCLVCLKSSRGQLYALLPDAVSLGLSMVPRGMVLTILPNRHEITVLFTQTNPKKANYLLEITSLIGARRR